jgi:hypothetical protein
MARKNPLQGKPERVFEQQDALVGVPISAA